MEDSYKGCMVIVRGVHSGVFFGTLQSRQGQEVCLSECRRIWEWKGAASISQLAMEGVKCPEESKIAMAVGSMMILDVVEILLCTEQAIDNLMRVKEWKAQ